MEWGTFFPNRTMLGLAVSTMIGELAALGAALSWTASAILYRKALRETRPILANIVRLILTSAILAALVVAIGKLGIFADLPYTVIALAGVSGIIGLGIGDTVYMMSLQLIGVARAVPITCTYPLFTLLFAFVSASQPPTLTISLGAVLIVIGVWLVSIERNASAVAPRRLVLLGVVMGIATAILWAISIAMMNLAVNYDGQLDNALAVNTIRVTVVGTTSAIFTPLLYIRHRLTKLSRKAVLFLAAGGLIALGLGWFFLSYSLTVIEESRAVPISSVTPLFSTLIAIFLFHEKLTIENALGSVIIVMGIFVLFLL